MNLKEYKFIVIGIDEFKVKNKIVIAVVGFYPSELYYIPEPEEFTLENENILYEELKKRVLFYETRVFNKENFNEERVANFIALVLKKHSWIFKEQKTLIDIQSCNLGFNRKKLLFWLYLILSNKLDWNQEFKKIFEINIARKGEIFIGTVITSYFARAKARQLRLR